MNVLFVTIAFFFVCVLAITMKTPHISRRFFTQIVLRKKILQALGIILFTALSVVLATAPPEETSSTTEVVAEWPASQPRVTASVPVESRVTKVVDGDTVKVETNGVQETVRIIGINTPETVDPRKPVECFWREASDKAKELLTGQSVRLEADATQGERDKYGRLIRYVFLLDGTDFGRWMIREGYAYEYTYATAYKYQYEYKAAQGEAQAAKRGLWAEGACQGTDG